MSEPLRNDSFRMLDEIVCKAVPVTAASQTLPTDGGRNYGMTVADEQISNARKEYLASMIQSEVARLAAFISASADPVQTIGVFQKFLLDKLASMQKPSDGSTDRSGEAA